jgi:hypothetical protein
MRPPKDNDEKGGDAANGEYQGQPRDQKQNQATKKDDRLAIPGLAQASGVSGKDVLVVRRVNHGAISRQVLNQTYRQEHGF